MEKPDHLPAASCCSPTRTAATPPELDQTLRPTAEHLPSHEDVLIPAGSFQMGDSFAEGYPDDGETPVHIVELEAFRMDTTAVTNEQFATFVDATGYRTEAENYGTSAVFHLVVQAQTSDVLGVASGSPW
ncbi:MAG: formylglycine-generating enzyme family protein, partial [Actinomycetota bacterium]|nr:formylglycine-generating enzyme family protein [Actinomycetota bacterium]